MSFQFGMRASLLKKLVSNVFKKHPIKFAVIFPVEKKPVKSLQKLSGKPSLELNI